MSQPSLWRAIADRYIRIVDEHPIIAAVLISIPTATITTLALLGIFFGLLGGFR